MLARLSWSLVWGAIVVSCFSGHSRKAAAANCALYARAITGVGLYGAAGGWWDEAAGLYGRGSMPAVGSILVFRRTGRIPSGHVAVVSKIVSPTEVLVDHANWYHGSVSHDMPVVDTSPNHDWTMVAALEPGSGRLGSNYPTYGFVYPQSGPRTQLAGVSTAGFDMQGTAGPGTSPQPSLFHFAIDEDSRYYAAHSRYARHRWGWRHSARFAGRAHSHAAALHAHHRARTRAAGLDRASGAG